MSSKLCLQTVQFLLANASLAVSSPMLINPGQILGNQTRRRMHQKHLHSQIHLCRETISPFMTGCMSGIGMMITSWFLKLKLSVTSKIRYEKFELTSIALTIGLTCKLPSTGSGPKPLETKMFLWSRVGISLLYILHTIYTSYT